MKKLYFECEFKSDIVLHASSNTEGKIEKLDYIPGSNFLGMVAREYDEFGEDAFEVFHSGLVRFGDGHIVLDKEPTFQVPFSWFAPKNFSTEDAINDGKITNRHLTTKVEFDKEIEEGRQPKQQRVGFFTFNNTQLMQHKHLYSQKSARNKDERRSKNGAMFGYYALPKGTVWEFCVEIDNDKEIVNKNEKYSEKIKELLESASRLGKSKSAEYGEVSINYIDKELSNGIERDLSTIEIDNKQYIFLYAYSRLALIDENSINSYIPTLKGLELEGIAEKVDFTKSNIRTSRYTPYVSARKNFDPERLVINKGSVIAVEVKDGFKVKDYCKKIEKGVGLYLSEGHGKVIVNPKFITDEKPFVKKEKSDDKNNDSKTISDSNKVQDWLIAQKKKIDNDVVLLNEVKEFIECKDYNEVKEFIECKDYSVKNKKSQWGQIRSLCNASKDSKEIHTKLFNEEEDNGHKKGFLLHGKVKDKWNRELIKALKERYNDKKSKVNYLQFVKLLSIYAPKEDDKVQGESYE